MYFCQMKTYNRTTLTIISVLLWIHFLVSSILLSPVLVLIWLVTRPFDRQLRVLHLFCCFWGALYIWVNPLWSLKIINRKGFDDTKAHIIVCNHQSLVDILVVNSLFKHFKWTSKVENFRLPFVGWVLSLNNSIPVYRGAKDAYSKFMHQALKTLKANSSIVIFPEGTRSPDGKMGKFKDGAFMLAHEAKITILPMVLDGTFAAVPKKGWIIKRRQEIFLKVLSPIPYSSFADLSVKDTTSMIRNILQEGIDSLTLQKSLKK